MDGNSAGDDMIDIIVKPPQADEISIKVGMEMTVAEVAKVIEKASSIPAEGLRIIHRGKILKPDDKCNAIGLQKGSKLFVVKGATPGASKGTTETPSQPTTGSTGATPAGSDTGGPTGGALPQGAPWGAGGASVPPSTMGSDNPYMSNPLFAQAMGGAPGGEGMGGQGFEHMLEALSRNPEALRNAMEAMQGMPGMMQGGMPGMMQGLPPGMQNMVGDMLNNPEVMRQFMNPETIRAAMSAMGNMQQQQQPPTTQQSTPGMK
eukprot:GHVU01004227.1.p1 GENE.GHVU01004227.1~~GHVU01004227.1.p1  ORF type:complete len:262 (+),score=44.60 GHVU01004227.1:963-1748(+)